MIKRESECFVRGRLCWLLCSVGAREDQDMQSVINRLAQRMLLKEAAKRGAAALVLEG